MNALFHPLKLVVRLLIGGSLLWRSKAWLSRRRASRNGVILGAGAWVHPKAEFMDPGYVSIGDGSRISQVVFCTHDGYATNIASRHLGKRIDSRRSVFVGRNTFLGHGAIVMGGARIGDDCVIGAGAVVRGQVPDGSVFIGNPARFFCTTEAYRARIARRVPEQPPTATVEPGLVTAIARWAARRQRRSGRPAIGRPPQLAPQSTAFDDAA